MGTSPSRRVRIKCLKIERLHLLIWLLPVFTAYGFACTCAPPPPDLSTRLAVAQWRINSSKVIFEGTVERIGFKNFPLRLEPGETVSMTASVRVAFSDVHLYRGHAQEPFTVETGFGATGDCGYRFVKGKSYLVYAWTDDSGTLSTSICSGTVPLDYAGTALRILRGEPPTQQDLADRRSEEGDSSASARSTQPKVCGKVSFPKGVHARQVTVYFWNANEDP